MHKRAVCLFLAYSPAERALVRFHPMGGLRNRLQKRDKLLKCDTNPAYAGFKPPSHPGNPGKRRFAKF
ncbi:MAG: hypothetical protein ACE5JU_24045, partial [Candidatus Binatia bacterium]